MSHKSAPSSGSSDYAMQSIASNVEADDVISSLDGSVRPMSDVVPARVEESGSSSPQSTRPMSIVSSSINPASYEIEVMEPRLQGLEANIANMKADLAKVEPRLQGLEANMASVMETLKELQTAICPSPWEHLQRPDILFIDRIMARLA